MNNMDDLLENLDGNTQPLTATVKKVDDKINYYENPDIPVKKIDLSKLKTPAKEYTICLWVPKGEEVPQEIKDKTLKIAMSMGAKGYTVRHTGDSKDALQTAIIEAEGVKFDSYLPWKKFNANIEAPKVFKGTPSAYGIAANSHRGFKKLPNAVRAILARDVMSILGPDCMSPVTLLLAYTKCGSEAISREMDFKVTGNLSFMLKVAGDSNVPVFNLKNEDATTRLIELLKSKESTNNGETE